MLVFLGNVSARHFVTVDSFLLMKLHSLLTHTISAADSHRRDQVDFSRVTWPDCGDGNNPSKQRILWKHQKDRNHFCIIIILQHISFCFRKRQTFLGSNDSIINLLLPQTLHNAKNTINKWFLGSLKWSVKASCIVAAINSKCTIYINFMPHVLSVVVSTEFNIHKSWPGHSASSLV